jgi:hypothetical protein
LAEERLSNEFVPNSLDLEPKKAQWVTAEEQHYKE